MRDCMAAVQRVAATQRALITTGQLARLGMTKSARANAVAAGTLRKVRFGVMGLSGVDLDWRTRVLAAVLAGGDGAVASHSTAALLWALIDSGAAQPGAEQPAGRIEITAERQLRLDGVRPHEALLPSAEVTRRHCVPVTSVARTLIDLALTTDVGPLLDEALRRRILTPTALVRTAARPTADGRRRRGGEVIGLLLADRAGGPGPGANAWEERMDRLWVKLGLPDAARQHWVRTEHGSYCVDRAIVELRIAVEWNGYEYHGRRSRFDLDSARRGHLLEVGWLVLDFTTRASPDDIYRTVSAAVHQRRAEMPAG